MIRSIAWLTVAGLLAAAMHSKTAKAFNPYQALFETGKRRNHSGWTSRDRSSHRGRSGLGWKARIILIGFADRVGREDYNLGLSLRRAQAIRDALVAAGVPAELISIEGRGESENAIPTVDGQPEQANRRVVIISLPRAMFPLPAQ